MSSEVDVLVAFSQPTPKAGEKMVITLSPVNSMEGDGKLLELEELHTKNYHLIIVSEDLSFFSHQHPRASGEGYSCDFVFPFGGKFILYNDIKPVGEAPVVIPKSVEVRGETRAARHYDHEKLDAVQEGLTARLDYTGSGPISVALFKVGNKIPASKVENYLGAKAHVVMIEVASKAFLHVHAVVHEEKLVLHASFPSKGTYRIWIQLKVEGVLHTLDFTLNVKEVAHHGHHGH